MRPEIEQPTSDNALPATPIIEQPVEQKLDSPARKEETTEPIPAKK